MTITELDKSVPTLLNIFADYISSIYFIDIIGWIVLFSIVVHIFESVIHNKSPLTLKNLKGFLKEYWLVPLLSFLIVNTIAVIYYTTYTQTSWEENQVQAYFDEQDTVEVVNIPLKRITLNENNLNKGHATVLIGGTLDKVEVTVKYDPDLDEPKLTYVVLNNDITYISKKPLYKKGEKVNHKLILPNEYNDKLVSIEYVDKQD